MTNNSKQHIFLVDDEPKVGKVVGRILKQLGLEVSYFACAADCLEQVISQRCDLLITDIKMPKMDGLELLKEIRHFAPWLPVLIITGFGNIPLAVAAVKGGALDVIEKPLVKKSFQFKVQSILQQRAFDDFYIGKPLTKSEMNVLKLIIDGKSNKEIARLLYRSVRTVEVHRSHLMHKLGVDNLAGLIKHAVLMGLVEMPEKAKQCHFKCAKISKAEPHN
jgi:two-component system response regulator FixJ